MDLIESRDRFVVEPGGDNFLRFDQPIPQTFLDDLADQRKASDAAPLGDFVKVASVPQAMVDQWLREGFDIFREPVSATVARLRAEDATAFLTSSRRF